MLKQISFFTCTTPLTRGEWQSTPFNCYKSTFCSDPTLQTPHGSSTGPNSTGVRPAGRVFRFDGGLYRITQRLRNYVYGAAVDLYRILQISPDRPIVQRLEPSFRRNVRATGNIGDWNAGRFHHIDLQVVSAPPDMAPLYVLALDGDRLRRRSRR